MKLSLRSYMKYKYTVTVKEEGKGRGTVVKFATLLDAQTYIKARWQGAEYVDGDYAFHTDYSTYALGGFDLTQIGTFSYGEWSQDYAFLDLTVVDPEGVYVVQVGDGGQHDDSYTYRVTGERLEQLRKLRAVIYYYGTEAAYVARAGGVPHYDYASIEPLWVEPPTALELSNIDGEDAPF